MKIINLETTNPDYFNLLVGRSQYELEEIQVTLETIRELNQQVEIAREKATGCLEDADGPMDSLNGFATDEHEKLNKEIFRLCTVEPSCSQNDHKNCLPVRKWQKEIGATKRQIRQIEKIIALIEKL